MQSLWKSGSGRLTTTQVESLLRKENGNYFSDLLYLPGSSRRAGRAAALDEAYGESPSMALRFPSTARALSAIPGAVLGSAIGYNVAENNPVEGAMIGSAIGAGIPLLLQTIYRRRKERESKGRALEHASRGDTAQESIEPGSRLASLVSGPHQQGRADTAEAVALGKQNFGQNSLQLHPFMLGTQLLSNVPYVGAVGSLGYWGGSVYNTLKARERMRRIHPQRISVA